MTHSKRKSEGALILAVARGERVAAVARSSGFSRQTVYKRLQNPAVLREVRATRRRIFGSTVGKLVSKSGRAIDVLSELLEAEGEPGEITRLRAAGLILELSRTYLHFEELEARVASLEADKLSRDRSTNGRA